MPLRKNGKGGRAAEREGAPNVGMKRAGPGRESGIIPSLHTEEKHGGCSKYLGQLGESGAASQRRARLRTKSVLPAGTSGEVPSCFNRGGTFTNKHEAVKAMCPKSEFKEKLTLRHSLEGGGNGGGAYASWI